MTAMLCCCHFFSLSQNRNSVWCFGDSALIDFSDTTNILVKSSSVDSRGSCTSMSDISGKLLFYTATMPYSAANSFYATFVFDSINAIMQNSDSIFGHAWYNELVTILNPANDSTYYLFSVGVTTIFGLYYSIIDMRLNNGLGAVTQKNIQLQSFEQVDCITAIKHGNGRDWWLLFRKSQASTAGSNNKWYRYLITPDSIQNFSVQSIGSQNRTNIGKICFSPSGDKLVFTNVNGVLELFDFDRCTGLLSNPVTIEQDPGVSPFPYLWSCAFSPDASKLYVTTDDQTTRLFQYDLNAPNIAASKDTLWTISNPPYAGGALKLAPDNKIYMSSWFTDGFNFPYPYPDSVYNMYNMNLSVINQPDSLGIASDFQPYSFYLGGKRTYLGLPNNPDYELSPLIGSSCDSLRPAINFAATDTTLCGSQCISFNDSSTKSPNKWQWFFSGAVPDTSTLQNPVNICYNTPGSYDVKLIACNEVGCDTLLLSNYIHVYSLPTLELGNDTSTCSALVLLDAGTGNAGYQWSTGDSTQMVMAGISSTYTVTVTDGNGCSNMDSVLVTINPLPVVQLGNDTNTCNWPVLLDAGVLNAAYQWSTGATTQTITAAATNLYTVVVTDSNNCSNSDSVFVTINPLPVVTFNAFAADTLCIPHGIDTINDGNPPGGTFSGTGVTGNLFDPNVAGVGWSYIIYHYTDSFGCTNTVTDSVWVDLCAGIAFISNVNGIKILSNPVSGLLTIVAQHLKGKTYTLTVTDIIGRQVFKEKGGLHPPYFTKDLDCRGFANGMYIVTLTTNKEQVSQKFIIN
ncbi:MAG: T9SS type A sorting domain-containing protein [Bacteroidia bacterium]